MIRVQKLPIPPQYKGFFTRFHIEVLPVHSWSINKGFAFPLANCCYCGELETLQHVFVTCKSAVLFWHDMATTLEVNISVSSETLKFLLTGNSANEQLQQSVMIIRMRALWQARTCKVEKLTKRQPTWEFLKIGLLWTCSLIGHKRLESETEWTRIPNIAQSITADTFGCQSRWHALLR